MNTAFHVRLLGLVLIFLWLAMVALGQQPMTAYSNSGLTFKYPVGWSSQEGKGVVTFFPAAAHVQLASGQSWVTTGIILGAYRSSESLSNASSQLFSALQKNGNPNLAAVGEWAFTKVDGSPSASLRFVNSAPGIQEKGELLVVQKGTGYVFWSLFCPADQSCSDMFQEVIDSIRFEADGDRTSSISPTIMHVSVEPSQSLIRNTVQVSAGQAQWFDLSLQRGSTLNADFKVEGGLNNKVAVWLLDGQNLQRFLAHQQFSYFRGTSGEVKGVGRYTFAVPNTEHYYLILDNGKAWLLPRSVKVYAYSVLPYKTEEIRKAEQQLEAFYSGLKGSFAFPDFTISIKHCGLENAFSDPNVTICQELIESLMEKHLDGAVEFVLFHELGHSLLRQWDYPLYDNEDVADEFATVFMVMSHHQQAALAAAQWWATSGTREEAMSKLYSDDRHTVSPQRARNIMRWLGEQDELVRRWQKIILPNMQDEALRKALSSTDKFDRASVEAELRRRGE